MLTRKEFTVPERSATWEKSYDDLVKAIKDHFSELNRPGVLEIYEAPITANQGLAFPATQVASTDANTLDDYEEESWTPGVSFGGGTTGITYTTQAGSYTKIGNRVLCTGTIVLSNKGSSTGSALITGLPFTVKNANDGFSPCAFLSISLTFTGQALAVVNVNTTTIVLAQCTEAGTYSALTDANFANTTQLTVSVAYIAA